MFISNAEKDQIFASIKLLNEQVRDLTVKVIMMGKFPEARKKRIPSEESRKAQSDRMKAYWANKKAGKA